MSRYVRGLFIGLGSLAVLAVLVIVSLGGEQRQQLEHNLRLGLFDLTGGGDGFGDGELVWRDDDGDHRITIEQLPTLDGRLIGSRDSAGPFHEDFTWYGISLRDSLAKCLQVTPRRVIGDDALDTIWLDVDAARIRSLFDYSRDTAQALRPHVLDGLLEAYELGLSTELRTQEVLVLRAGPGWERHLVTERRKVHRIHRGDGYVALEGGKVSQLLDSIRAELAFEEIEGIDRDQRCDLELRWRVGDASSLEEALAETLDLHLDRRSLEREVTIVEGVPRSPVAAAAVDP